MALRKVVSGQQEQDEKLRSGEAREHVSSHSTKQSSFHWRASLRRETEKETDFSVSEDRFGFDAG